MKALWLGVLVFFLSVCAAAQRTIHVPGDAATIQAGIDAASDGDTVSVSPGTYVENITFRGKNITVTSGAGSYEDAAGTVLTGRTDGPVVRFDTFEKNTAVLNGFTISGGISRTLANAPGGGVYVSNASPTISNNNIVRNYGCGILALSGASPIIIGNHIADGLLPAPNQADFGCQSPQRIGLGYGGIGMVGVGDVRIESNLIENSVTGIVNDGARSLFLRNNVIRNIHRVSGAELPRSLFISLSSPLPEQITLIQNLIYKTVDGNLDYSVDIANGSATTNIVEIGNTFYGPQALVGDLKPSTFENNIIVGFGTSPFAVSNSPGITCITRSSDLTFKNNLIFNTGPLLDGHCPVAGNGNLQVAPAFRDAASGDFREQDSSPTRDAGDIAAPQLPAADLGGKNRTVCGKVDIGAYQLHPHPPISLTVAPNPVAGGSPVVFTATLTGNCNVPTGVVTFLDNGTAIGTGTLSGAAIATLSTSFLTVGQHNITVTYPGDFNFEDSTSNAVSLTVTGLPSATALSVQPNPAKAFQLITFTASVTDPFVQVTGTVTFTAGTTVLGTAPVVNGVAALSTSQLGAGTYPVAAAFNATTQFAGSSATVQLVVNGSPTTTTLQSSLNPSLFGQTVTFTATTVLSGLAAVSEGTVAFRDGAAVLGTVPLSGGRASLPVSTLAVGSHGIVAQYSGSKDADPSASAALTQVVSPVAVALQLTAAPNPAHFGDVVNLRLSAIANDGRLVNGTANFFEGTTGLGTAAISNGAAALPVSNLSIGTHTITATYADPANGIGFALTTVKVEVTSFDFALSSSGTKLDIPYSGYAEVTLTLTPLGSYDRPVHLSCTNLPQNSLCSFARETTEPLSKGPQTVKLIVNANVLPEYGPRGTSARLELWNTGGGLLAAGLFCFGLRRRKAIMLCAVTLFCFAAVQGCSGKLPASTPVGDYVVNVVAQDATGQTHSVALQMHVR